MQESNNSENSQEEEENNSPQKPDPLLLKSLKFASLQGDQLYKEQYIQDKRWLSFNSAFQKFSLFKIVNNYQISEQWLSGFNIISHLDPDFLAFSKIFSPNKENQNSLLTFQEENITESKCIATFLGSVIGDTLGQKVKQLSFDPERKELGTNLPQIKKWIKNNIFIKKEKEVIHSETSLSHCIADSFLSNNLKFNPIDIRMRFLLSHYTGYCTSKEQFQGVIGGFNEQDKKYFKSNCPPYAVQNPEKPTGDISLSGPLARLAPILILHHNNQEKGEKIAFLSSLISQNSEEAAELCKLITHLVIKLLNYSGNQPKQDIFDPLGETFQTDCESVQYLAWSKQEPERLLKNYNPKQNQSPKDRYWNWKDPELKVSPTRYQLNPEHLGRNAIDAAYIALNIVYHSYSFEEGLYRAINMGGQANCIASIVGYISGAMYGISKNMLEIYSDQVLYNDNYQTVVKAVKLSKKSPVKTKAFYEVEKKEPYI